VVLPLDGILRILLLLSLSFSFVVFLNWPLFGHSHSVPVSISQRCFGVLSRGGGD
jgi:hypothetical protein